MTYTIFFTRATIFGDQQLTRRGTADTAISQGFYPSDIAKYVIGRVDGVKAGVIEEASQYIVRQAAYRDGAHPEAILEEMAKFVGWHYGTWEPLSIFETLPRVDFRPRPSTATAILPVESFDELSLSEHLANLYNQAQVNYQDADGTSRVVTVTKDVETLARAGIDGGELLRTTGVNLGLSTSGIASVFGIDTLLLLERQARAAGSVTLSGDVYLPSGGTKPASHLKAGLDNLQIPNLPHKHGFFDLHAYDQFRIKRAEHTADKSGRVSTRLELDDGADLIEVLQARLDTAVKAVTG